MLTEKHMTRKTHHVIFFHMYFSMQESSPDMQMHAADKQCAYIKVILVRHRPCISATGIHSCLQRTPEDELTILGRLGEESHSS